MCVGEFSNEPTQVTVDEDPGQRSHHRNERDDIEDHGLNWQNDRPSKEEEQDQNANCDPSKCPWQSLCNTILGICIIGSRTANQCSGRSRNSSNGIDQRLGFIGTRRHRVNGGEVDRASRNLISTNTDDAFYFRDLRLIGSQISFM